MYEEALAEFQKEKNLSRVWYPGVEIWIGISYAKMDRRGEAQKVLDALTEQSKQGYIRPTNLASLYFALGENDQGFKWLEKGYEERDSWMISLKINPIYDSVRSDPRFKALLKKMGLEK